MSQLALYLLGSPRIERNGKPIEIVRRKAIALLAYLAVTGESHSRESLAALLWPEYDQRRSRADLRRTLSVLNKALNGEWLHIERDRVSLNRRTDFWLDVTYFRCLLTACQKIGQNPTEICSACLSDLTEAVSLYRDDFLAGFTLPDSANFDEWQFFETERLHSELAHALEILTSCHGNRHEFEAALNFAQRWLGLDPFHEPAHRQLMLLYAQTDQRAAALRQYQICTQSLQAELGISPSPETTAMYQQIHAGEIDSGQRSADTHLPPLDPAIKPRQVAHNLPAQPTPFIGRRRELAEIADLLAEPDCRLLTLIGPGGIGKTRLALESAVQALSGPLFTDGVYFVPLAAFRSTEFLVTAIGQALKLTFYGQENIAEDPRTQLLTYLQEQRVLLVLDNFEHLLAGSDLLVDILQIAPAVKIMVTSQERLNLQSEWVQEVQGMRSPTTHETAQLEDYSAVRLFLRNARRIQADFTLTDGDKPHVIRICQLVGGMPLGLQLAAAWVRQLSCQEIVREIENNLDFLATSWRDMPERHRSLRAVFEHSWTLLSDAERQIYRQLSVFQGGFHRTAAEQVTGASLPLLSALTDKSFLHKDTSGRYEMHEVLRQYAAEKLHEVEQEEEETLDRACDYFAGFLQPRFETLMGHGQKTALAEISDEFENLRASWQRAVSKRNIAVIEQSVESLYHFHEMRGWIPRGIAIFGQAVKELTTNAPPGSSFDEPYQIVLGKLMAREGAFYSRLGRSDKAQQLLQDSLAIFQRFEVAQEIPFTLNYLGMVARLQGDYQQAKKFWQESLAIYRQIDRKWGTAWSLNLLGHITGELEDYQEAKRLLQESLTIRQQIGNRRGMAGSLNSLGYILYLLGEYEEARPLLEEGLAIRREIGYRRGIAISLNSLGRVAEALGHLSESKRYFLEALQNVRTIRAIPITLDIMVGLSQTLVREGHREQALTLLCFPLGHPASGQNTKDKAQTLWSELEAELSPAVIATTQTVVGNVNTRQLEATVAELLSTQAT